MKRIGPQLVLGLLLGVFVWTGWRGLDFGHHWDEQFAQEMVSRPLESGVFLPGSYNYPSIVFDIGTVALLHKTIPFLVQTAKESPPYHSQPYSEIVPKGKVAPLVAFAKSKPFLLRLRVIFLILTALTGLWVFLAVRACKRSGWEAVFAAAVILTSWEIAYHARWVAPDAIQMQFVALWLMCFALALHSTSRAMLWLYFSAAAAGLACGTKYQGGILLLPVVIYAIVRLSSRPRSVWAIVRVLIFLGGIFTFFFLVSTPGALLQPLAFCQSVRHVGHQYATGHFGYTVGPAGEHGYLLLVYLSCVLTSHWPIIALVMSGVAGLGIAMTWKESRLAAILFLSAPLVYLVFMVCYRVMIARNYLAFAPFIAFFAARGASHIWKVMPGIWPRRIVVTGFVALFASNLIFLCFAARTIGPDATRFVQDIVTYLQRHSDEKYFVSPKVRDALVRANVTLNNITPDPATAQRYVVHTWDAPRSNFASNRLGQYRRVSGPLEVNVDYYADWQGEARVVDLSMQRAREMRLLPKP